MAGARAASLVLRLVWMALLAFVVGLTAVGFTSLRWYLGSVTLAIVALVGIWIVGNVLQAWGHRQRTGRFPTSTDNAFVATFSGCAVVILGAIGVFISTNRHLEPPRIWTVRVWGPFPGVAATMYPRVIREKVTPVTEAVIQELVQRKYPVATAGPILAQVLEQDYPGDVGYQAALAMESYQSDPQSLVPHLRTVLKGSSSYRDWMLRILGRLGVSAKEAAPEVRALLRAGRHNFPASVALMRIDPSAWRECVPELNVALTSGDISNVETVLDLLDTVPDNVIDELRTALLTVVKKGSELAADERIRKCAKRAEKLLHAATPSPSS